MYKIGHLRKCIAKIIFFHLSVGTSLPIYYQFTCYLTHQLPINIFLEVFVRFNNTIINE